MDPKLSLISDGKKFMWDGVVYDAESDASQAAASYQKDEFEIRTIIEDGKFLVYTRRSVKQVTAQ